MSNRKPARSNQTRRPRMKAVFSQDSLTTGLNAVAHGIAKHSTLPILTHVQITATAKNTVTFTATDLEIALWRTVAADVSQPGSICVPFRVTSDIASRMADDAKITLSTK